MRKTYLLTVAFILMHSIIFSQDYSKIKTGIFYYYPPKSYISPRGVDYFLIERNDSIQMEINPKMKDTSYWRINMDGDCILKLNCIGMS
jgi:hypothetical protein